MSGFTYIINMGTNGALASLSRLQSAYSGTMNRLSALTNGFQSRFSATMARLPRGLNMATQSVDQLKAKLDGLTRRRDLSIDTREIRRVNREIDDTQRRIDRLTNAGRSGRGGGAGGGSSGGAFSGLKSMLPALGIAGLLAGGGALAKQGMDREQTKVAFEQFVGKAGVDPLMKNLNRFADVTPYDNEQVYNAGRTLMAAKVGPQELTAKMTNIGNMAAVSKGDFGDMSRAYAQAKQRGVVGNDLLGNQFSQTDISNQLQKNLGVNGDQLFKMAEQRKVKFDDLDKAIADLSAKGGLYEGGLEKLSATAGGKLSTFMGTFANKVTEWAATQNSKLAGIFDFGSEFLAKMGPIEEAFGKLMDAFAPLWPTLHNLFVQFGLISEGGSSVEGIVNAIAGAINLLTTAVSVVTSPFGQFVLLMAGAIKTAMMLNAGLVVLNTAGITSVGAGLKALWGIMMANPIGMIVGALVIVGTALKLAYDNVEWFRNGVDKAWGFIKNMFSNVGVILRALLMPTPANLKAAFAAVGKAWTDAGASVEEKRQLQKRELAEGERDDRSGVYKPGKPSPFGNTAPGGKPSGPAKAGGLDSTVSGSKSTSITVNFSKELVSGGIHIVAATLDEGLSQMEDKVKDVLLRVLNSPNSIAS